MNHLRPAAWLVALTGGLAVGLWTPAAPAAPATNSLAGNWVGTLKVGQVQLRLLFKIVPADKGRWKATMDSLDQGARDLPVDEVSFKSNQLSLVIGMIKASYDGILDPSGKKFVGQWQQGKQSTPLTLELTAAKDLVEDEKFSPAELAASKLAAQKLEGIWNGSVTVEMASLRLRVTIAKAASGAATGSLDSPDQGLTGIPLTGITYKEGKVRFEARGLASYYEGSLANEGTALLGQWHQGGQTMTLNFRRPGSR